MGSDRLVVGIMNYLFDHMGKFQRDFTESFKFISLFSFIARTYSKIDILKP